VSIPAPQKYRVYIYHIEPSGSCKSDRVTVGWPLRCIRELEANISTHHRTRQRQKLEYYDDSMSGSAFAIKTYKNLRAIRPQRPGTTHCRRLISKIASSATKFSCDLDGTKIERELPQHRRKTLPPSDLNRLLTAMAQ
jgi:hypothetical protein